MPAKKTNDELNGSARFMPKSDDHSSEQSDTNLLSDEPETPSVLAEPEQIETADNGGGEKLPKQSSGAGKWVVIVLLVLALGGLGYWYYYKTKQNNAELAAKQSQIADLQAGKDKLAADLKKAQDSATASSTDSDYVVIKEWGVKFKPDSKIADLTYGKKGDKEIKFSTISLTSSAITASNDVLKACDVGSSGLGYIIRAKKGEAGQGGIAIDQEPTAKKIGDYYYLYTGPSSACSDDKATVELQTAQVKALKDSFAKIVVAK